MTAEEVIIVPNAAATHITSNNGMTLYMFKVALLIRECAILHATLHCTRPP